MKPVREIKGGHTDDFVSERAGNFTLLKIFLQAEFFEQFWQIVIINSLDFSDGFHCQSIIHLCSIFSTPAKAPTSRTSKCSPLRRSLPNCVSSRGATD